MIDTAQAITKRGWKSIVISEGGRLTEQLLNQSSIHLEFSPWLNPLQSPFEFIKSFYKFCELLKAHKIDLIHARNPVCAWYGFGFSKKMNIPIITTCHGPYGHKVQINPLKYFWNTLTTVPITWGTPVIFTSKSNAHLLITKYKLISPFLKKRSQIIYRGVDTKEFDSQYLNMKKQLELKKSWKLNENRPLLLLPGRFSPDKGQLKFIEALKILITDYGYTNFDARLVGDNLNQKYYQELEEYINKFSLHSNIMMMPFCKHMCEAYALADLVITPSLFPEPFGRVIIEAMAMKKIVIANRSNGPMEIIENGIDGYLVDCQNPRSLCEKIYKVITLDIESKSQITENAHRKATHFFSLSKMMEKKLQIYEDTFKTHST